ncbi:Synaptonemal complex protein 1 [Vitis vinifera]|uniref:Synaptonemal complex protein 1 n=1 Tax=Vitis vinifera TaxID=29760 RepID=A0A438FZW6_VITVI|nr:Synaptonemal complex protein 1 [Vitis vinifera]
MLSILQITCIQQEHDRKELSLKADHSEELKRVQLQAEDDLREKTILLRNEHEVQIKVLRHQHEDECKKLQEELDRQKSREDRQRALLQLQWKVMSDKTQEDPEVNSKKDYSISSIKMRDSSNRKRSQCALDSPFPGATQTPVSNLLKKVENVNPGSAISVPNIVTHHEYEVETTNGRTITKRRKTKSTVMFGDPRKHKKANTPKAHTPRAIVKEIKGDRHLHPSNIGELFSEGSLNPYADDPYAFD